MCNINARAIFPGKYGVSTNELLHFPMMFSESMKGLHVPGVPLVRLEFLYEVCGYFGISEGSVRTALSRMKKMGVVETIKTADSTRYRVSPMQIEVMNNFTKRLKKKEKGFVIAIYSFEKHQEKERISTRTLLQYAGFVRFAQNSYINMRIDQVEFRKKLEEMGVSANVFLFNVDEVADEDLGRMADAWKIPRRSAFLDVFFEDLKAYYTASDGSDADVFIRQAGAWVAFVIHVHGTEPPLPDALLPKNYAFEKIMGYLTKMSLRDGRKMMRYYKEKK